jgi:DNA-binding MarR family transcriptional regulator
MTAREATTERLDLTAGLIRSAALIYDTYARVSSQHGLTPQRAQLLCVVGDQPSNMVRLCALLRIGKSSMTGLVDRAERAGLIARVHDPNDGRAFVIDLTPAGRSAAEVFRRAVTDEIDAIISALTADERDALAKALSKVVLNNKAPDTWPVD